MKMTARMKKRFTKSRGIKLKGKVTLVRVGSQAAVRQRYKGRTRFYKIRK